jgi:hypothetical protein
MKWWMWTSVVVAVVVGAALLIGKDDIARIQRMHRM